MRVLFFLLLLAASHEVLAEDREIAALFAGAGVTGTVVIASLDNRNLFIHDDVRALHRFPPASTFKILNTLVALEEGSISGKTAVLAWDGQLHSMAEWNRDQTLESAFRVSCVWCYQELARRVGTAAYRKYIAAARYGELQDPFALTDFWLDGSLLVSATEQLEFLRRLHRRELPFRGRNYDILRQIMLVETTPAYSLWAKSGWANRVAPQVGWYVGYVETGDKVWLFVSNMIIRSEADLPLRRELTVAALRAKGVIE